jgi:NADH-quinone oxidoreductase subunit L
LGVGAWSAAIFHFMIHAFFKALLFLGAGAVILSVHHEHNMYKMGGLRKELPVTFWTFLIASASLAAFPLVTAGFYSKDAILWFAWSSTTNGSEILWVAGWIGAFTTAIYTFRMVFLTFYGNKRSEVSHKPGWLIKIPLIVLAVFALIGGFIELPDTLGHVTIFSSFLDLTLPAVKTIEGSVSELTLQIIVAMTAFLGIYIAYRLYIKIPVTKAVDSKQSLIHRFLFSGWGFDWLYDKIFIQPVVFFAKINKNDFIDYIYTFIAWLNRMLNQVFALTQTGNVRWYAMGIVLGAVITLTIVTFL